MTAARSGAVADRWSADPGRAEPGRAEPGRPDPGLAELGRLPSPLPAERADRLGSAREPRSSVIHYTSLLNNHVR